jgi:hypothetical protein
MRTSNGAETIIFSTKARKNQEKGGGGLVSVHETPHDGAGSDIAVGLGQEGICRHSDDDGQKACADVFSVLAHLVEGASARK